MGAWRWVAAGAAVLTMALAARQVGAQEPENRGPGAEAPAPVPQVNELVLARMEAERAHLHRVGWWGLMNLVGGAALWASASEDEPGRGAFGMQTAGWGLVNGAIALAGLRWGGGDPPDQPGAALAAESRYAHILLVNLGLNAGYMGVGTTLAVVGRDQEGWDERRGHGTAVVVQGFGLLVLDLVAYLQSRERLRGFQGLLDRVEVAPDASIRVRVP